MQLAGSILSPLWPYACRSKLAQHFARRLVEALTGVVACGGIEKFCIQRLLIDPEQATTLSDDHLPALEARICGPEVCDVEVVHVRIGIRVSEDADVHAIQSSAVSHRLSLLHNE